MLLKIVFYLAPMILVPYLVIAAQASVVPNIFLKAYGEDLALTITTYAAGVKSFLSFITGPLVGIASDFYGRKVVVLFGFFFLTLPLLVIIFFEDQLVLFMVLNSIGGCAMNLVGVVFAWAYDMHHNIGPVSIGSALEITSSDKSDSTLKVASVTHKEESKRLEKVVSILTSTIPFAYTFAPVTSAWIYTNTSHRTLWILSVAVLVAGALHVAFIVPAAPPTRQMTAIRRHSVHDADNLVTGEGHSADHSPLLTAKSTSRKPSFRTRLQAINPLAALPLVMSNVVAANYLLTLFIETLVQGALFQTMVLYDTQYLGLNEVQNGECMLVWGTFLAISSVLTVRVQTLLGPLGAIVAACSGMTYVSLIMGSLVIPSAPYWASLGFFFGGQIHATCTNGVAAQFSSEYQGRVQGVANGVKFLGEGLGPPIAGYMMNKFRTIGHAGWAYNVLGFLSIGWTLWLIWTRAILPKTELTAVCVLDDSSEEDALETYTPEQGRSGGLVKTETTPLLT